MNYLRCCGGCGGSFLVHYVTDEIWFCPKCTAALPEFDPQPYAKCEGQPDKQQCRYQGRVMVVLAREGNDATVRPLGNPDALSHTVHVNNLRPIYVTPGR